MQGLEDHRRRPEATSPAGLVTELEIGHFDLLEDSVIIDGIPVAALDDLADNKA